MTDVIDVKAIDSEKAQQLKSIGWVSYLLHLVVAVAGVLPGMFAGLTLLIVALVIDLVKQGEAVGTWQESHFKWRIKSTIWAGILYVITMPLWLLLAVPGWIAWILISIWFLYRIVRGMVAMNNNQAIGN